MIDRGGQVYYTCEERISIWELSDFRISPLYLETILVIWDVWAYSTKDCYRLGLQGILLYQLYLFIHDQYLF